MRKIYVIYSLQNHKFYTGRYWDIPFSADVLDAEEFKTEEEVKHAFCPLSDPAAEFGGLPDNLAPYEIRTLYVK